MTDWGWEVPKPKDVEAWRGVEWRKGLVAWREEMLRLADGDAGFQAECLGRCLENPAWWFDGFLWTNSPHDMGPSRHVPFVLWQCQERFVGWMLPRLREGRNSLVDKSRDMGVTWLMLGLHLYEWLFDPNALLLVGTITKDKLEGESEDALMPKLDYMIERLPAWMLPPGWKPAHPWRKPFLLKNHVTGAEILGEACTRNFGRSGRRTAGWIDEAGEVPKLEDALSGCSATVGGLTLTSTPQGRGNAFGKIRFGTSYDVYEDHGDAGPDGGAHGWKWGKPGLHWTMHPLHSKGFYLCEKGCPVHVEGGVAHSPWYDALAEKLNHSAVDLAQQADLNYAMAGRGVFSDVAIQAARRFLDGWQPEFERVDLQWDRPGAGDSPDAIWRSWRTAGVVGKTCKVGSLRVLRRPRKGHVYVLGGDPSSNSDGGSMTVASVWDATDGLVVAEWYGRMDPDDTGLEWAKLARWYSPHGCAVAYRCYCVVESNGPGKIVNKVMDRCGCMMHAHVNDSQYVSKTENRLGVYLTRHNREPHILENLVPFVNKLGEDGLPMLRDPFIEAWNEFETFTHVETATGGELKGEGTRMGASRGCYDDRVFARCHMLYGCRYRYGRLEGVVEG